MSRTFVWWPAFASKHCTSSSCLQINMHNGILMILNFRQEFLDIHLPSSLWRTETSICTLVSADSFSNLWKTSFSCPRHCIKFSQYLDLPKSCTVHESLLATTYLFHQLCRLCKIWNITYIFIHSIKFHCTLNIIFNMLLCNLNWTFKRSISCIKKSFLSWQIAQLITCRVSLTNTVYD